MNSALSNVGSRQHSLVRVCLVALVLSAAGTAAAADTVSREEIDDAVFAAHFNDYMQEDPERILLGQALVKVADQLKSGKKKYNLAEARIAVETVRIDLLKEAGIGQGVRRVHTIEEKVRGSAKIAQGVIGLSDLTGSQGSTREGVARIIGGVAASQGKARVKNVIAALSDITSGAADLSRGSFLERAQIQDAVANRVLAYQNWDNAFGNAERGRDWAKQIRSLAMIDPQGFGQLANETLAPGMGARVELGAGERMKLVPALGDLVPLGRMQGGSLPITLDLWMSDTQAQWGFIRAEMTQFSGMLRELAEGQKALVDDLIDRQKEEARAKQEAMIAAKQADFEKKLRRASATLGVLSDLIEKAGRPELASDVRVVSDAGIKIARAVPELARNLALFDSSKKLTDAVSSIITSGNIVSAAFQIFKLFNKKKSEPQADPVLSAVKALQDDVRKLRMDLQEHFAQVNGRLDRIFEVLLRNDWRTQLLQKQVTAIQTELYSLREDLNRIYASLYSALEDLQLSELKTDVVNCLGKGDVSTTPQDEKSFLHCEGDLFAFASITAKGSVQGGPDIRDFRPIAIADELNNFPLVTNINFLNQYHARVLGFPEPLFTGRLANLESGPLATRAWLQLMEENPTFARNAPPEHARTLHEVAEQMDGALSRIARREVFAKLIEQYRDAARELDQALQLVEARYRQNKQLGFIEIAAGPRNPLDPPRSSVPYKLQERIVPPCDGAGPSLPMSADGDRVFGFPSTLLLPRTLKLKSDAFQIKEDDDIAACYEAFWDQVHGQFEGARVNSGPLPDGQELDVIRVADFASPLQRVGRLNIRLRVALGRLVFEKRVLGEERCINGGVLVLVPDGRHFGIFALPDEDPEQALASAWRGTWRPRETDIEFPDFPDCSDATQPGQAGLEQIETQLRQLGCETPGVCTGPSQPDVVELSRLIEEEVLVQQRSLYEMIIEELQSAPALNSLGRVLTGRKRALQSYVSLGMARTLEQNEALSTVLYETVQDPLPDEGVTLSLYDKALPNLRVPEVGGSNGRVDFLSLTEKRAAAVGSIFSNVFDRIEAGLFEESNTLTQSLVVDLDVFEASQPYRLDAAVIGDRIQISGVSLGEIVRVRIGNFVIEVPTASNDHSVAVAARIVVAINGSLELRERNIGATRVGGTDNDVVVLSGIESSLVTASTEIDRDGDGIVNGEDPCSSLANAFGATCILQTGDVDGTGAVDAADLLRLMQVLRGGQVEEDVLKRADVARDGRVDVEDLQALLDRVRQTQ